MRGSTLAHLESSASNLFIRHCGGTDQAADCEKDHLMTSKYTHKDTDFSFSALNKSPQKPGGKAV